MPTVHELTGWAARLAEVLDAAPDDADDAEVMAALHLAADAYEAAVADKVDAIGHVLEALETHRDVCKADAQRYGRLQARWEARRQRVYTLLGDLLTAHARLSGRGNIKATSGTAYLQDVATYTYPDDVDQWPEEWVQVRRVPVRSKAQAALKAGEQVPDGFAAGSERRPRWRRGGV